MKPNGPEPAPKYFPIHCGGITTNMKLMIINMFRKGTRMFLNIFNPFLKPKTVFSLSSKKETKLQQIENAIKYKALLRMQPLPNLLKINTLKHEWTRCRNRPS
jgi:hypothetical protein